MKMIDMHCDTLLHMMMPDKTVHLSDNDLSVDLKKLKEGCSYLQMFAIFTPVKYMSHMGLDIEPFDFAQMTYKRYVKELELNAETIAPAKSYSDILRNEEVGKLSSMLTVEEGAILDNKLNRIDDLYDMGVRVMSLTWNDENCLAYPNSKEPEIMNKGLKEFGIEAVKRMNDLGIVIDVSHLSDGGFWDVIKYSSQPIVATHSNARSITSHTRNLTDEMLIALRENGGVTGINFGPEFLGNDGVSRVSHMVNHINHIKSVAGIDVIALGSDFDGIQGELEIKCSSDVYKLKEALLLEGFSKEEVEKIWYKNVLRVIKKVIK